MIFDKEKGVNPMAHTLFMLAVLHDFAPRATEPT